MRRTCVITMILGLLLGVTSLVSMAGEHAAAAPPVKGSVTGEIVSADVAAQTLVVKEKQGNDEKETTFTIDEKTKVLVNGKPDRLESLKAGQTAMVVFRSEDGKVKAEQVAVTASENPGTGY